MELILSPKPESSSDKFLKKGDLTNICLLIIYKYTDTFPENLEARRLPTPKTPTTKRRTSLLSYQSNEPKNGWTKGSRGMWSVGQKCTGLSPFCQERSIRRLSGSRKRVASSPTERKTWVKFGSEETCGSRRRVPRGPENPESVRSGIGRDIITHLWGPSISFRIEEFTSVWDFCPRPGTDSGDGVVEKSNRLDKRKGNTLSLR